MKTRKSIVVMLILSGLLIGTAHPGDEDRPTWKSKYGFFKGGAGGFEIMYLKLNIPELNQKLKEIGLPPLDDYMTLTGGGGWGFLGKGIRVGGYGFGGEISKVGKPYEVQKEVSMAIGLGGFLVEKVFHPFNKTEVYVGLNTGAGGINIRVVQWTGPRSWDELWDEFKIDTLGTKHSHLDYKVEFTKSFAYIMPSLGFRYNVFRWFAVGLSVNYIHCRRLDIWRHEQKKVPNAPELNLSNMAYRINFYFGG